VVKIISRPVEDVLFGDLAEQYQTNTRNLGFTKRYSKAHEVHYSPWVQELVSSAPVHLEGAKRVGLPAPDLGLLQMPLGQAIGNRRSGRIYGDLPVPAECLSTLLYAGNGVRPHRVGAPPMSRNVTNAGNLGSVELYPIVMGAEGLAPGIYHYDSVEHDLGLVQPGDFGVWLREVVFYQVEFGDALVAVVLSSAVGRLKAKYGPRGYRFAMFDVGHVSENIYLAATALRMPVCATAGFVDEELNRALSLDGLDSCVSLVLLLGSPVGVQSHQRSV
jgi:SagB-type dehydrogenase family enzyme